MTRRKHSRIGDVAQLGYELVPKRKRRGKPATFNQIAKIDWTPWTRDPGMTQTELMPKSETLVSYGVSCRMSYAIMLMPRDELIAMHGKVEHDHVDAMMADIASVTESLKALVLMCDTAYLRILASAAAAHKKGVKFPGVHDMRKKKRVPRKA